MTPITPRTCAALALAVTAALPFTAHAQPGGPPVGRPCHFASQQSTTVGYSGEMDGGPLVAAGSPISIRCSIHVGNDVHSGAAADEATAGPSDSVVVLAPTEIGYEAEPWDSVSICTEATVGTTTWYWSGGSWSTNADERCVRTRTICCPPDFPDELRDLPEPLRSLVGHAWCLVFGDLCDFIPVLDVVACPALAALSPGVPGLVDIDEEGDVFLNGEPFWDCPPYDIWS